MGFIQNGVIVQNLKSPTGYMAKYLGANAYNHFPLCNVEDIECRRITREVFSKELEDGFYQSLEFISNKNLLMRYVELCKKHNIPLRVLFVESEYPFEQWTEEKPICRFIGYEYCEIPFDSQIITDFSWHTPLHCFRDKINEFGIFDNISDAQEFKNKYDKEFEEGNIGDGEMDTYICKLFEVDLNQLSY